MFWLPASPSLCVGSDSNAAAGCMLFVCVRGCCCKDGVDRLFCCAHNMDVQEREREIFGFVSLLTSLLQSISPAPPSNSHALSHGTPLSLLSPILHPLPLFLSTPPCSDWEYWRGIYMLTRRYIGTVSHTHTQLLCDWYLSRSDDVGFRLHGGF